jgi:hypothetical protein
VKIHRLVAVATAALLATVAAGCADDPAPVASAPTDATSTAAGNETPDPCQLLTVADLQTATGITFEQRPEEREPNPDPPGYRSCTFEEAGGETELPRAAWVALYPTDRADFDRGRDALMALPLEQSDIAGVGEAAYGNSDEIRVFQAPWYVEVQVQFGNLDGTETIVRLAQTVLARLP